jgi:hypothetical protein
LGKRKKRSGVVWIANPTVAGARYTTRRQALRLVKRRRAKWRHGALFFFDSPTAIARAEAAAVDAALRRYRGGVVYWNGSDDPTKLHRPGEARS